MSSSPVDIKDYFTIGDFYTAALVSNKGSIDWLCLPHFDSPSIFGKLLDKSGGFFSLVEDGWELTCDYKNETAITDLSLSSIDARLSLHDFMLPQASSKEQQSQCQVRQLTCHEGDAEVSFVYNPRPDYARESAELQVNDVSVTYVTKLGRLELLLPDDATVKEAPNGDGHIVQVVIKHSETKKLILRFVPSSNNDDQSSPSTLQEQDQEQITSDFWREWVARGTYVDFCRDKLVRSAITLKLMQFAPTGAMVASPTTSLPEEIGGVRNWDYRYVWIRDATFTLYAFYVLGHTEEAERFFEFIYGIVEQCEPNEFEVSLMYTVHGEPVPAEISLDHWAGYKGSKPVRIGNQASEQLQLDVYGALIDAYYFASKKGFSQDDKAKSRRLIMNLVKKIDQLWQLPDSGIWEVRSEPRQHAYSKIMCWVGVDRAGRMKDLLDLNDEDLQICSRLADTISDWVWQHCYDEQENTILSYPDAQHADSTNLLFVLLQFLDKHDDRTSVIIDNTRQALVAKEIFVYRYKADDGLAGNEGAFVLCSYWLISALAIMEQVDDAYNLFKKMESVMSPHGLLSEEIDPDTEDYLGNYPQAFSHLGYIMSAFYLHKYMKRHGASEELQAELP